MNYRLQQTSERLQLEFPDDNNMNPIAVDFLTGANYHRYRYGGGRGQLISRACGLHKRKDLRMIDGTAGLGADAFVLACLGAKVTMLERSPILHALLKDGLERAQQAEWFSEMTLDLIEIDAIKYLEQLSDEPDVIYLDPMYPNDDKSALAKKEMRVLREIVGDDNDAEKLLSASIKHARNRVVVKRPRHAPTIDAREPSLIFKGKSSRFDVYLAADCLK